MTDLLIKDEWEQLPPADPPDGHIRYRHKDGRVLAITEGVTTFDELKEKRANPPPEPPSVEERLAALETRLSAVEKERKVTPSKREDK